MALWSNILIRKYNRRIRFLPGATVKEYNAAGTVISDGDGFGRRSGGTVTHPRGAGAVPRRGGTRSPGGDNAPMKWVEEWTDLRNSVEIGGAVIGGYAKVKFFGTDEVPTDFGVMTFDSHAPDPSSAAGVTALAAVQAT